MKRKLICLLLCVLMLVPSALAVDLYVDGKKLETDTEPTIVSGRTLVPVRAIFESLGAEVFWDAATWTVTATKGDTTITMSIGNTTAYVNGAQKILDVPAQLINSRTMVPARFVSEALNANVRWEGETETVYIATKPEYDGYTIVPDIIYSTSAEENGLGDTFMFADGVVTKTQTVNGYPTHILKTDKGQVGIINLLNDPAFYTLSNGDTVRVCFLYMGYSEVLNMATGAYAETGNLNIPITYPGVSVPSTTPTTPTAPTTPTTPTITPEPEPQQKTVYITPTGKRYHYLKSCGGKNAYAVTIDAAKARGLTPCKKCAS